MNVAVERRTVLLAIVSVLGWADRMRQASACSVSLVCFFAPDSVLISEKAERVLATVVREWNALRDGGRGFCGELVSPHQAASLPWLDINGHAWENGDTDYNLVLSERRARAVARRLVSLGMDENHMRIIGFGDARPLIVGAPRNEPQNLRVEMSFNAPG